MVCTVKPSGNRTRHSPALPACSQSRRTRPSPSGLEPNAVTITPERDRRHVRDFDTPTAQMAVERLGSGDPGTDVARNARPGRIAHRTVNPCVGHIAPDHRKLGAFRSFPPEQPRHLRRAARGVAAQMQEIDPGMPKQCRENPGMARHVRHLRVARQWRQPEPPPAERRNTQRPAVSGGIPSRRCPGRPGCVSVSRPADSVAWARRNRPFPEG